MTGKAIQFQGLHVRQRFRRAKAGDVRNSRVSAQIQENALALQSAQAAVAYW